ncbi:MAG: RNA-binding S4 domain-containing protein [Zhaonellaceae bacterium]|jgi:ribosomal 50S subunit-recycling heat shock protein|nr:RNA-binding S4 domain-containing protein [Clostridia bacterium]
MRLDKFLKVSRLIKRRTVAKEVCDNGRVTINGKVAKAASEVNPGDVLVITFGQKVLTVKILETRETVKAQDAKNLYEILGKEHRVPEL